MARYGKGTPPFKETDTLNPVDPYGLAKVHAEEHLNLMSDIYDFKVFHMVPHNVSGPHQCYSDPFRNVMSIFANRVKKDKPVYIYGDGEQMRSFSHVDDCIDAFITLYNKKDHINNKEVFNIGPDDGTEMTITQLAHKVSAQFNKPTEIINVPDRPREVKRAWVSTEKAKKLLNYAAKYTPDDTIRDTVAWMRNQPDRDFNYHLELEIVTKDTPRTWTDKLFNK
jgi:UDP-glucose 4-epimerase